VAYEVTLNYINNNKESNMHKASGFMAGYMHKSGLNKQASLQKQARTIGSGQASFLKALFPSMNIYNEGENVKPIEISNPHTRQTFKLPSAAMVTGGDTRNAYS
jgi:hypothetical protein